MIPVRILLGAFTAILIAIAALPAVVLLHLAVGGTGLGICPTGLGTCSTSAFTLMELLGVLTLAVAAAGAGVVACLRVLSRRRRLP